MLSAFGCFWVLLLLFCNFLVEMKNNVACFQFYINNFTSSLPNFIDQFCCNFSCFHSISQIPYLLPKTFHLAISCLFYCNLNKSKHIITNQNCKNGTENMFMLFVYKSVNLLFWQIHAFHENGVFVVFNNSQISWYEISRRVGLAAFGSFSYCFVIFYVMWKCFTFMNKL